MLQTVACSSIQYLLHKFKDSTVYAYDEEILRDIALSGPGGLILYCKKPNPKVVDTLQKSEFDFTLHYPSMIKGHEHKSIGLNTEALISQFREQYKVSLDANTSMDKLIQFKQIVGLIGELPYTNEVYNLAQLQDHFLGCRISECLRVFNKLQSDGTSILDVYGAIYNTHMASQLLLESSVENVVQAMNKSPRYIRDIYEKGYRYRQILSPDKAAQVFGKSQEDIFVGGWPFLRFAVLSLISR